MIITEGYCLQIVISFIILFFFQAESTFHILELIWLFELMHYNIIGFASQHNFYWMFRKLDVVMCVHICFSGQVFVAMHIVVELITKYNWIESWDGCYGSNESIKSWDSFQYCDETLYCLAVLYSYYTYQNRRLQRVMFRRRDLFGFIYHENDCASKIRVWCSAFNFGSYAYSGVF